MPFTTTADAVPKETSWLRMYGDGLPALLVQNGGKWDLVQAYAPRTPAQRKNQIWVLRRSFRVERFAEIRRIAKYEFELMLSWTLSSGSGSFESDQGAFDDAIDDVVARVGGFLLDKTHGGRFMAAAEDPTNIEVTCTPPMQTVARAVLEATVRYTADDYDFTG